MGKVALMGSADDGEWAICCSGGGIRSASFCLGALQRLQSSGLLARARLIMSVSGGSYIAASRALVAADLAHSGAPAAEPAYAPGTPEEQHLRDNTHYLIPDATTLLLGVFSLLHAAAGSELKPTVRVTDLELAHPGNYNATEGHSPNWV